MLPDLFLPYSDLSVLEKLRMALMFRLLIPTKELDWLKGYTLSFIILGTLLLSFVHYEMFLGRQHV